MHSGVIEKFLRKKIIVGDAKNSFIFFFLVSNTKAGEVSTNGQSVSYQTFSYLQLRLRLKNLFIVLTLIKDTRVLEKEF